MKNYLNYVFILIIIFCSCEKQDIDYPIVYESSHIIDNGYRIFTYDGEVIDIDKKGKIIEYYKSFFVNMDTINLTKSYCTYTSHDSVEIKHENSNKTYKYPIIEKNNIVYWESPDTVSIYLSENTLIDTILLYKPLYFEAYRVPSPPSLTSRIAKQKDCIFLNKRSNLDLSIPMISYIYHSPFMGKYYRKNINNVFNEDFPSKLEKQDTIIIQEFSIELIKQ